MKRRLWHLFALGMLVLVAAGCMKPYHEQVLAEISNSQEGFLSG